MQEIKEKIRKIYQKSKTKVSDDYIENAIKDKKRVKELMKLYEQEKIESMNYILGKSHDNKTFTEFEMETMSKIDLFDMNMINLCKIIWANRKNKDKLERFLKILDMEVKYRMNNLQIFKNENFGEIRAIEVNDEPYFVAKDVCDILEIGNPSQALARLDEDEKSTIILNEGIGNPEKLIVNEYGLYSLILGSRKKEAKEFKRWITHEVIPSIRKHGGYIAGQEQMTDDELMAKAVLMASSKIKELDSKNKMLLAQNSELTTTNMIMKPKAEYFDELVDRNLLMSFRDTAKALKVGEKNFISFLLNHKYIYRDKKGKLQPFADKNNGLFEIKESLNDKTGWCGTQTLITPKGRETFRLLYLSSI